MAQRYSSIANLALSLTSPLALPLASSLGVVPLSVGLSLLADKQAIAATFAYQENPAITNNVEFGTRSEDSNTLTISNVATLTNTSSAATPDTIYIVPFIFSLVDGNVITLGWENAADAYVNNNYDGLGNSLDIAIANFAGRVRLSYVADLTGKAPLPLTIPCDDSPSCPPPAPLPLPVATQDASDALPFFELGTFATGETKTLDLVLDFSYEDSRTGVLPILPTFSILSATTQTVPEPAATASWMGLIATGSLVTVGKQAKGKQAKRRRAKKH